jgi:hypothetical protein
LSVDARLGTIDKLAARHGEAVAAFPRLGIGPVDIAIARHGDAHHAALPARIDRRGAGERRRHVALGIDDAQRARRLFAHQHPAVGQEGQAPGV